MRDPCLLRVQTQSLSARHTCSSPLACPARVHGGREAHHRERGAGGRDRAHHKLKFVSRQSNQSQSGRIDGTGGQVYPFVRPRPRGAELRISFVETPEFQRPLMLTRCLARTMASDRQANHEGSKSEAIPCDFAVWLERRKGRKPRSHQCTLSCLFSSSLTGFQLFSSSSTRATCVRVDKCVNAMSVQVNAHRKHTPSPVCAVSLQQNMLQYTI